MSRLMLAGLMLLIGPFGQIEPSAQLTTDGLQPLVGEPVAIELSVTLPAGSEITSWPDFATSWTDFEIADISELTIHDAGSHVEYQQRFMVRLWEPGDFQTPETVIRYQLPDSAGSMDIVPEPLFFTVPSVLTGDETLRRLKPQVSLPYVPSPLIFIALAVVINVGIFVYDRWRLTRANRVMVDIAPDIRLLDKQMLAILRQLDQQKLEPAAVYNAVSHALREYLCRTYPISGHELTTGELLGMLREHLSGTQLTLIGQLLNQADLVKFAKYQPGYDSARRYVEVAAKWLHTAETENARHSGEAA